MAVSLAFRFSPGVTWSLLVLSIAMSRGGARMQAMLAILSCCRQNRCFHPTQKTSQVSAASSRGDADCDLIRTSIKCFMCTSRDERRL